MVPSSLSPLFFFVRVRFLVGAFDRAIYGSDSVSDSESKPNTQPQFPRVPVLVGQHAHIAGQNDAKYYLETESSV